MTFGLFREEEDYKAHLKTAEDAQLAATVKRKVSLIISFDLSTEIFFFRLETGGKFK